MTDKTLNKILIAIAYLTTHNIKVNKSRVAKYTNLSWATVNKYFEDILPSQFLIVDIENFKNQYEEVKNEN